jgi:membrane protein YqaA with SNARE-associated domain
MLGRRNVTVLVLVGGIFLLALVASFVPLLSVELALIVSAAAGTSIGLLLAQVAVAAAGQMIGKSCYFLGGRTAFQWCECRDHAGPPGLGARLLGFVTRNARRRRVAAATVFFSASTGLPPFALVSALAGGWRMRLSSFFVMGFAGKSARFAGVILVPGALAAFHG